MDIDSTSSSSVLGKRRHDSDDYGPPDRRQQAKSNSKASIEKPLPQHSTLRDFLTSAEPTASVRDYSIPKYFVLQRHEMQATFTWQPPKKVRFKAEFVWREQQKTIILCSDWVSEEITTLHEPSKFYSSRLIPLLKSHLQKCVRRSKQHLAYRAAYHLMKLDTEELLRTLPKVVLEDAVPNPQFAVIVWLLCATSRGFRLPYRLQEWLLGFVESAAGSQFQDPMDAGPLDEPAYIVTKDVAALDAPKRDLLYSIQLVKAFVKSKGDILLIDKLTITWIARMLSDPHGSAYFKTTYPVHHVSIENIQDLAIEDFEPSAVDPNCSDIIDLLRQELTDEDQDRWQDDVVFKYIIKEKISLINNKRTICGVAARRTEEIYPEGVEKQDVDSLWQRYRKTIGQLQRKYLKTVERGMARP